MEKNFELGPIRPPSEASSILLRITRNCPWNKCAFCSIYKRKKFSRRTVEELKRDIDTMYLIKEKILEAEKNNGGNVKFQNFKIEGVSEELIRNVMFWHRCGMKSLFLQDADSLVIKTEILVEVLEYFKERFPSVERITTYARARTVSRKTADQLKQLRKAGISRIHIGMESGSADVLKLIDKGVTPEEQVDAGVKAMEAGFEVSEYFMPGIGGAELSEKNAVESAKVLNKINPTFIRLRSAVPVPRTPLFKMMQEGAWIPLNDIEKVKEIKLFIENLDNITSTIKSDHIMNLIEDVEGTLPRDKKTIINLIDRFLNLNDDDKESFIIGRRTGRFRLLSDFRTNPEVEMIKEYLKNQHGSIDRAIEDILMRYI